MRPVNPKHIKFAEYAAIVSRIRELGRNEAAYARIAAEFNRGVGTIRKLAPRVHP